MIFFLAQNIWLDVRLTKQPFVATCNFVEKVLEVLCSLECNLSVLLLVVGGPRMARAYRAHSCGWSTKSVKLMHPFVIALFYHFLEHCESTTHELLYQISVYYTRINDILKTE